jgi:hypothetical protein
MKIKKCDALSYILELAQERATDFEGVELDQYYSMRNVAEDLLEDLCDCTDEELRNSPQNMDNYINLNAEYSLNFLKELISRLIDKRSS